MVDSLCSKLGCFFKSFVGVSPPDCKDQELEAGEHTWFYAYEPENPVGRVALLDLNAVNLVWFVQLIKRNLPRLAAYSTYKKVDPAKVLPEIDVFVTEVVLPKQRATIWLKPYQDLFGSDKTALIFTSMVPEKEFCTVAKLDGWRPNSYCHYLPKPWNVDRLLQVVVSCLEHKGRIV